MKIYRVGGAVRDRLLGLPVKDEDFVVVGATAEELRQAGYRPVGRDFPVFLHPQTQSEYALARKERKVGPGYRGFTVDFAPEVTLEEDLARRDLTINAIAEAPGGGLIDPYGGEADLHARVLRHVSPAFVEDPVRLLRVARFAARFDALGFSVAPETRELMGQMVANGEVDALVPERVWGELERALGESAPQRFFEELRACGALQRLFPELDRLFGVPQPPKHHPEVDTGVHTLLVLAAARSLSDDPMVAFAALMHDLGKGLTDPALWPAHHGHEQAGAKLVERFCQRWRIPVAYRELAVATARLHGNCHRAAELRPQTHLKLLEQLDFLRRPERLGPFLLACEADSRGRTGFEKAPYPQADIVRRVAMAAQAVRVSELVQPGMSGAEIGAAVRKARIDAIRQSLAETPG
ncbi:MAG: multifunctional CCA addition/repair protein [Gammaproteobacteria bacterium]|nr:multifunctional CCA addition/repair protein [Gammaproteobacteria bacterium]